MAKIGGSSPTSGDGEPEPESSDALWRSLFKVSVIHDAADWYGFPVVEAENNPQSRFTVNFDLESSSNPLKEEEMNSGFVRFDEAQCEERLLSLFSDAGIVMGPTWWGDLVGTWSPNSGSLKHLTVVHRCSIQRDANGKLFLWWYSSPLVSCGQNGKSFQISLWMILMILSPATFLAERDEGAMIFVDRFPCQVYAQLREDAPMIYRRGQSGARGGQSDVCRVPARVDLGYLISLDLNDETVLRCIRLAISVGNRIAETLEAGFSRAKGDSERSFHHSLFSGARDEIKSHDDELRIAHSGAGQMWIPGTRVSDFAEAWAVYE